MGDWWLRVGHNLIGRLDGPLHFRFVLQPLISILFAVRDGVRDARGGRPAYLWAVFTDSCHRRDLLRGGCRSIGRVFILAFVLDVVYQMLAFAYFYPMESLLTAFLLAIVPYAVLRGPINRVMRHLLRGGVMRPVQPEHS